MREIDFLPDDYRNRRSARRSQWFRLTAIAAVVAFIVGGGLISFGQRRTLVSQLAVLDEQRRELVSRLAPLDDLRSRRRTLEAQAELCTWLESPAPRTRILAAVTNCLPEAATLDSLQISPEAGARRRTPDSRRRAEGSVGADTEAQAVEEDLERTKRDLEDSSTVVLVGGAAPSDVVVAAYIAALQQCDLFTSVRLLLADQGAGEMERRFRLRLVVRPGWQA